MAATTASTAVVVNGLMLIPVYRNATRKLEQILDQILARMTLPQKVAQMIQPEIGYLSVAQMRKYGFGSYLNGGNTAPYGKKRASASVWLKYADEMYEASVDASQDGSRIPTIWGTDAMHGHSNVFGATLFPHNIGLGAAHDPELIHRIGVATAKEVAATRHRMEFCADCGRGTGMTVGAALMRVTPKIRPSSKLMPARWWRACRAL
ncbi:MAG: glycoside hydrolase family 3 N-terminal domain-containing protein [Rheinheimera sp.]|nr:glycoside hydrolase family 3 N-terminal domain-containing protein [Rheinheimera sp.]